MLQQQAFPYKAAQFCGAAIGVAVGCLLGMIPLAFMAPGFFVGAGVEQAAEAAAAVAEAVQGAAAAAVPADPSAAAAAALKEAS